MRLFTAVFLITVSTVAKKRHFDELRNGDINHDEEFEKELEIVDNRPIPFGHIFRDGFEDPTGGIKQPIDGLELSTVYLKDGRRAREYIKKHNMSYQLIKVPKRKYLSPRDLFLYDKKNKKGEQVKVNDSVVLWDIAAIQQRNLYDPPKRRIGGRRLIPQAGEGPSYSQKTLGEELRELNKMKSEYFDTKSFNILSTIKKDQFNFSTCDEFGTNAKFHPKDIVDIDWVPFYIWTTESRNIIAKVHKFTYPTKKLVAEYMVDFLPHIHKTLDWDQPKILMTEDTTEVLLVAANRRGLFHGIPYVEIPTALKSNKNVMIPTTTIRLKLVRPYLAMMYCEHKYANIMAVSGNEPTSPEESKSKAAKLNLKGVGFPVERDLAGERRVAKAKKLREQMREEEKFITLEDQKAAAQSLKSDSRRSSFRSYDPY